MVRDPFEEIMASILSFRLSIVRSITSLGNLSSDFKTRSLICSNVSQVMFSVTASSSRSTRKRWKIDSITFISGDRGGISSNSASMSWRAILATLLRWLGSLSRFSKDNATANRTARAQENNRLGVGRELGRVARKSDLAKNNRTRGMWKHMFPKFICSLVLWDISRLFFALLKSDWKHKHAWLMNLVRWLNYLARWMECSILNRF